MVKEMGISRDDANCQDSLNALFLEKRDEELQLLEPLLQFKSFNGRTKSSPGSAATHA
jgi:hypothetical protein